MKRIFLSLMFLVAVFSVKADQLAYITKSQAEKAVAYLKSLEYVIEFCGCCDGSYEQYLFYTDVYAKHTGYENYYEVILLLDNYDGTTREHPIDLAYIHILKDDGLAHCLGLELGFECDPCTEPFEIYYEGDEGYEGEYLFMSKSEAESVKIFLNNQKIIYYYCACCDISEDYVITLYKLTITSIEIHQYEDFELVELEILTNDQNGETFYITAADLFAIFIPETSTYAYSLSRKLNLTDFDSCVDGITLK